MDMLQAGRAVDLLTEAVDILDAVGLPIAAARVDHARAEVLTALVQDDGGGAVSALLADSFASH